MAAEFSGRRASVVTFRTFAMTTWLRAFMILAVITNVSGEIAFVLIEGPGAIWRAGRAWGRLHIPKTTRQSKNKQNDQ